MWKRVRFRYFYIPAYSLIKTIFKCTVLLASLEIHQKQCIAKREKEQSLLPPHMRTSIKAPQEAANMTNDEAFDSWKVNPHTPMTLCTIAEPLFSHISSNLCLLAKIAVAHFFQTVQLYICGHAEALPHQSNALEPPLHNSLIHTTTTISTMITPLIAQIIPVQTITALTTQMHHEVHQDNGKRFLSSYI